MLLVRAVRYRCLKCVRLNFGFAMFVVSSFVLVVRANDIGDTAFDNLGNGPPERPGIVLGFGICEEVGVDLAVVVHGSVDLGKEGLAGSFVLDVVIGAVRADGSLLQKFRETLVEASWFDATVDDNLGAVDPHDQLSGSVNRVLIVPVNVEILNVGD